MKNRNADPPPPLPLPSLRPSQSEPTSSISPVPPMPTDTDPYVQISKETYAAAMGIQLQQYIEPFTPCYMFFYGSHMDPEVLQSVPDLPHIPTVAKGSIKGFSLKMWGIYPTIIRSEASEKIPGIVWKADLGAHFLRLQKYETKVYTWCLCDVELEDRRLLRDYRAFCWAGDGNSKELEDGSFYLLRYQKYFKSSIAPN